MMFGTSTLKFERYKIRLLLEPKLFILFKKGNGLLSKGMISLKDWIIFRALKKILSHPFFVYRIIG